MDALSQLAGQTPPPPTQQDGGDALDAMINGALAQKMQQQSPQPAASSLDDMISQAIQAKSKPQGESQISEGAQAKQRILDNVAQLQKMGYGGRLLDEIKGAPELAASILTGLGSNIASGFGGAYTLAKEGINNQVSNGLHFPTKNEIDAGFDSAANSAHNIQSNYTYQPTSLNAKNAQEEIGGVIGGVHQGLASTGGDVGNVADSIVGNKPQVGSGPIGTFMQSAAPAAFDMATTVSPLASAEGAATRAANIGRSTERVEPILGTPTARQPMAVPDVGDLPPVAARNTTSNVWRPGQSPDIPASGASNAQLSALDQLAKD